MSKPFKHFLLTPEQAEEKALIAAQLRTDPRGPWVNGKITNLPKLKGRISKSNKKN